MIADQEFIEVNSPDEIPEFANEDEEHEFWSLHCLGPGMLARMWRISDGPPVLPLAERFTMIVRLEGDTIRRLAALAARKGAGYDTLLEQFISERLYEEEKREGLLADS